MNVGRILLWVIGVPVGLLAVLVGALTAFRFMATSKDEARELAAARASEKAFRASSASDMARVVELARALDKVRIARGEEFLSFGSEGDEPMPKEFSDLGFRRLIGRRDRVDAFWYKIYEGGPCVQIDFRPGTAAAIHLVDGRFGEVFDLVFEEPLAAP